MVAEGDLAGVAPDDVAEAFGGGVEVPAGGVERGVAEEGLQLDDVGAGLEASVANVWRRAWTMAPGGMRVRRPARV